MRAVCFHGSNDVRVERVPDPELLNARDAIVRVTSTSICGSDLHLYDGYIPTVKQGDILGHEFMGEVVEVGRGVTNLAPGDRVVVPSIISCGACFYCKGELWSLCDNGNPNAALAEKAFGYSPTGIFGYSHLFGGYAGSHAEYVRVPFADVGPIKVPNGIADEKLLFISDAFPTGYMGADLCDITPGDTVAVWGCGAVGQFAIKSAFLLGAGRVIGIDRYASRLETARRVSGAETLNYEDVDVVEALKDMTAGRGPDACIDAVGLEAHGTGAMGAYDMVKQQARLETDRPHVLREAVRACRKGGTFSIMGVYGGFIDKFPMGAAFNKGLTLRMGQMHAHKYLPRLLEHVLRGDVDPSFAATHPVPLDEAQAGYQLFKKKNDECMRVVFRPLGEFVRRPDRGRSALRTKMPGGPAGGR